MIVNGEAMKFDENQPFNLCDGKDTVKLTSSVTLMPGPIYILSCQLFVEDGAVLTIAAGVTIYAIPETQAKKPTVIVVNKGGRIVADGDTDLPITFTAINPTSSSDGTIVVDSNAASGTTAAKETRGKWGGIVILGKAPTTESETKEIEGLDGYGYGGVDPYDASGVLRYVRVWHAGAAIAADNELNGITFGGVGSGTVVEYVEVAFNADDGFEFFGGTVNVKYLSVLFVGDDAFDSDQGYQGKGQFLFAMIGNEGHHGTEMDGKYNKQPRSHPQFYSMTIIGGGANSNKKDGLMRLREGTGGKFGNVVLAYGRGLGLNVDKCSGKTKQECCSRAGFYTKLPTTRDADDNTILNTAISIGTGARGTQSSDGYLYFSDNNIIYGVDYAGDSFNTFDTDCMNNPNFDADDVKPVVIEADPGFAHVDANALDYTVLSSAFNPLPSTTGKMCMTSTDDATVVDPKFFEAVDCKGAFGGSAVEDNWLRGWSWLDCAGRMADGTCSTGVDWTPFAMLGAGGKEVETISGGPQSGSMTLSSNKDYVLASQLFMTSGATLTIEAGTTIYALPPVNAGAPSVIVQRGATINAAGTKEAPITMTTILGESVLMSDATFLSDSNTYSEITLGERGKWGGLIVLGDAPTTESTSKVIEGFGPGEVPPGASGAYGGTDAADSSGVIQYVRVWHGGAYVSNDNEINGMTFGGVGSGTTVDHCEVAYNADDGFEFFGGTVDVKYLSVMFVGDDCFDTDQGYQGKGQFLFGILGREGGHATEMDSKYDSKFPRSHPQFYSMTLIGGGANQKSAGQGGSAAMMRLREGTGGKFGNIIMTNLDGQHPGVYQDECSSEQRTPTMPSGIDQKNPGYLYFSRNNIIHGSGVGNQFMYKSPCSNPGFSASSANPYLAGGYYTEESGVPLEVRAGCGSEAYTHARDTPESQVSSWYDAVDSMGAFPSQDNWLDGWSIWNTDRHPGFVSSEVTCPTADNTPYTLCGDITEDTTWPAGNIYILACQIFVKNGATLSIGAGVTVSSIMRGIDGKAPAIIVERGANIVAEGSADAPITFTALNPEKDSSASAVTDSNAADATSVKETRGQWGGLILLGKAPTSYASDPSIEGLPDGEGSYGGSDPADSSGVLKYVRVWHGGAVIGADNEINGITFGGVGSGTVVEHCEVAFNMDDGFEFFGGTVNVKYLSVLFVGDDAFDSDKGYQGKGQFLFAMLGVEGGHGTEMDNQNKIGGSNDVNSQPRSHPQFTSMTIIGDGTSGGGSKGLMHLREGTGGKFENVVLAYGRDVGLNVSHCVNLCGKAHCDDTVTDKSLSFYSTSSAIPSGADIGTGAAGSSSAAGYLYFSEKNFVYDCPKGEATAYRCPAAAALGGNSANPGFKRVTKGKLDWRTLEDNFDPMPTSNGQACSSMNVADSSAWDSWYDRVSCSGAFKSSDTADNWMKGWSWLDCSGHMAGGSCSSLPESPFVTIQDNPGVIGGVLKEDLGLATGKHYLLTEQLFVPADKTLSIAKGAVVYGLPQAYGGVAPAVIVQRGGKIFADGTETQPITFTTILAESALESAELSEADTNDAKGAIKLGKTGKWGGIIVLGKAPTANPANENGVYWKTSIEGLEPENIPAGASGEYGGIDPMDNSGSLTYVRVWHGGSSIGADNEINGMTFGGVGSGTQVSFCEVAYNKDDGFEFFGGTVNVKYLSVLFGRDDAFDTDQGYQGKGQFLFAMLADDGGHATEMDGKVIKTASGAKLYNTQPRSHPQFYNFLFVGHQVAHQHGATMNLREGTGGKFGNGIILNPTDKGVYINQCGDQTITQTLDLEADIGTGSTATQSSEGYLFFSENNIVVAKAGGAVDNQCPAGGALKTVSEDPMLANIATEPYDPRPACGGSAYSGLDAIPDEWFDDVGFKGAFGNENWLAGWSYLQVGSPTSPHIPPFPLPPSTLPTHTHTPHPSSTSSTPHLPTSPPVRVRGKAVPGWRLGDLERRRPSEGHRRAQQGEGGARDLRGVRRPAQLPGDVHDRPDAQVVQLLQAHPVLPPRVHGLLRVQLVLRRRHLRRVGRRVRRRHRLGRWVEGVRHRVRRRPPDGRGAVPRGGRRQLRRQRHPRPAFSAAGAPQ